MNHWSIREIHQEYFTQLKRYMKFKKRMVFSPDLVTIRGVKLLVNKDLPVRMRKALYRERYEDTEARCILAKLEHDDIVMEIGAGYGFISILCSKAIGSKRVFTYEANPALIPTIKHHFLKNHVSPTLTNAALSTSKANEIQFQIESEFWASSIGKKTASSIGLQVPNLYINDEIHKVKPTFLIMDVEGYEAELLPIADFSGICKILVEFHPNIIGEDQLRQLRSVLTHHGYTADTSISERKIIYLERIPF